MESYNTSILSLFLLLLHTVSSTACPTPLCDRTTNCELFDYISDNYEEKVDLMVSIPELNRIYNPSARIMPFQQGFMNFDEAIQLSYDLVEKHIGNLTDDCLHDNQGEQCSHKIVARPLPNADAANLSCGFEYLCDYDRNRIPQLIWKAQCLPTQNGIKSFPIYYKLPILKLSGNNGGCNPFSDRMYLEAWDWTQIEVPVACTCE